MPYFPVIESAVPRWRYAFGRYRATLLDEVRAVGAVQYFFLLVVYEVAYEGHEPETPTLVVASEYSGPDTFVAPVLGLFDGDGHSNFGASAQWLDIDGFADEALAVARRQLRVSRDNATEVFPA